MQYRSHSAQRMGILRRTWAGVVGHHTPTFGGLVVNVGRHDEGLVHAIRERYLQLFDHTVHGTGQRKHSVYLQRCGPHRTVVEHGLEGSPNVNRTQEARSTRMHAHNILILRPAGHQLFNVTLLQRFVKRSFDVVGRAAQYGRLGACAGHGMVKM